MAGFDDAVSLIFKIATDSKSAVTDIQKFRKIVADEIKATEKETATSTANAGSSISGLASSFDPVVAGVTATITAMTGVATVTAGVAASVGASLFAMTKSAADFGSEIHDAADKTGLSAKTLSALKFAADESSSSLEEVSGGVTKFSKLIAQAAEGSDQAAAKLKRLGIDPKAAITDLDGAFAQVVKRIYELPPGVQQNAAAFDAFGKSGVNLIATIKSFHGNVGELIEQAEKLGLTLTDKDAAAADQFGDTIDTAAKQVKGLGYTIGNEFMPIFQSAFSGISQALADNREQIKTWATNSANFVTGLGGAFTNLEGIAGKTLDGVNNFLRGFGTSLGPLIIQLDNLAARAVTFGFISQGAIQNTIDNITKLTALGAAENERQAVLDRAKAAREQIANNQINFATGKVVGEGDDGYTENLKQKQEAAKEAQKEAEEIYKRLGAAALEANKIDQQSAKDAFTTKIELLKQEIAARGASQDDLEKKWQEANTEFAKSMAKLLTQEQNFAIKGKLPEEINNIHNELVKRSAEASEYSLKLGETLNQAIIKSQKEDLEIAKATSDKKLALLDSDAAIRKSYVELEITNEATKAQQIGDIEQSVLVARQTAIEESLKAVKAGTVEEINLQKDLALVLNEIEANRLATAKNVAEGDQQRINRLKEEAREIAALSDEQINAAINLNKIRINELEFEVKKGENVRANLQEIARLEIESATLQRARDLKELDDEKAADLERIKGKADEEERKFQIEELYKKKRLISEGEFQDRLKEISQQQTQGTDENNQKQTFGGGLLGALRLGTKEQQDHVVKLGETVSQVGQIIGSQFNAIAQAVGNAVKSFVLLGSAGGSFRKFAAELIASIAQMATVQAVYEVAQGLAMLAIAYFGLDPKAFASAQSHFAAAAAYGLIGGVAAIAGRATAGNLFQQQASGAATQNGTNAANQTAANQAADQQRIIEITRQQAAAEVILHLRGEREFISNSVIENVNNNGSLRQIILKTADA